MLQIYLFLSIISFYLVYGLKFTQNGTLYGDFWVVESAFCHAPPIFPETWNLQVVVSDPPDGCDPLINNVSGMAVLFDVGWCSSYKKAFHAQQAGAKVVIFRSDLTWPYVFIPQQSETIPLSNVTCFAIEYSRFQNLVDYVNGGTTVEIVNVTQQPLQASQRNAMNALFAQANYHDPMIQRDPCTYTSDTMPSRSGWGIGLACDLNGMITYYAMDQFQIAGSVNARLPLPSILGDLTELQGMEIVNDITLSGSVPLTFGSMKKMRIFHIQATSLESIDDAVLQNWNSLIRLDLTDNRISAPLPNFYSYYLEQLALGGNKFYGPIPQSMLEQPLAMSYLDLSNNLINGSVPSPSVWNVGWQMTIILQNNLFDSINETAFQDVANIKQLNLNGNRLTTLPANWSGLATLIILDISQNYLTNLPDLTTLTSLLYLYLSNNSLTGDIPSSVFPYGLGELDLSYNQYTTLLTPLPPYLIKLQLSYNNLTMEVDNLIFNLPPNYLAVVDVSHNDLFGQFTTMALLPFLTQLDMSYNNITGSLRPPRPVYMFTMDFSFNNFLDGYITDDMLIPPLESIAFVNTSMSHNGSSTLLPHSIWFGFERSISLNGTECPSYRLANRPRSDVQLDPSYHEYQLCRCKPGYYHGRRALPDCEPCLANAICPGYQNPLTPYPVDIFAMPGFFPIPTPDDPTMMIPCRFASVNQDDALNPCNINVSQYIANLNFSTSSEYSQAFLPFQAAAVDSGPVVFHCADGYTDRLCSRCEDGWFRKEGRCIKCSRSIEYPFYIIILLIILSLVLLFYLLRRPLNIGVMSNIPDQWSFKYQENIFVELAPLILAHYQYQTIVTSKIEKIDMIQSVQSFFGMVVLSSPNSGLGFECADTPIGFVKEYILTVVFPGVFLAALCITFALKMVILKLLKKLDYWREVYLMINGIFSFLNAIFFPLATYVIGVFQCTTDPISGQRYFADRPYLTCETISAAGKIIPLILYPFGIFVFFASFTLYISLVPKSQKEKHSHIFTLGFWYLKFKPTQTMCALYFLLVRLYLSLVVGLVPSTYDYFLLLIAGGLFFDLIINLYYRPFLNEEWNKFKITSTIIILFIFLNAVVSNVTAGFHQTAASIVIYLGLNTLFVLTALHCLRQEWLMRKGKLHRVYQPSMMELSGISPKKLQVQIAEEDQYLHAYPHTNGKGDQDETPMAKGGFFWKHGGTEPLPSPAVKDKGGESTRKDSRKGSLLAVDSSPELTPLPSTVRGSSPRLSEALLLNSTPKNHNYQGATPSNIRMTNSGLHQIASTSDLPTADSFMHSSHALGTSSGHATPVNRTPNRTPNSSRPNTPGPKTNSGGGGDRAGSSSDGVGSVGGGTREGLSSSGKIRFHRLSIS